jgi:hypothetical protein
MSEKWVVWSEGPGAWWGPGWQGYVTSLLAAGRYDKGEALDIMARANRYLPEGRVHEIAMPDPWPAKGQK